MCFKWSINLSKNFEKTVIVSDKTSDFRLLSETEILINLRRTDAKVLIYYLDFEIL